MTFNSGIAKGAFYHDIEKDVWVYHIEITKFLHRDRTFTNNEEHDAYFAVAKKIAGDDLFKPVKLTPENNQERSPREP